MSSVGIHMCLRNFKNITISRIKNMKFGNSIFKTFFLSLCIIANTAFAYAQTASILPLAKTQFTDQNGKPLTSGTVDFYVPTTTTHKTTWQDSAKAVPNSNPVVLDSAGRGLIWGDGSYRQVVKDRYGNIIWDQVTSSIGSGGSGGSTIGDGLSVGTILPTSDIIAPANYQFAYGQAVSRSTYPELFAAITVSTSIGCVGGSPIINVSDTSYVSVGTVLESICAAGSPTVISKTSSTVTLSANATITVSTTGRLFPYGNGDALATFNLPDMRGYVPAGRCNMGGVDCSNLNSTYFSSNSNNSPSALGAKGGSQSKSLLNANLPPQTPAGTVSTTVTFTQVVNGFLTGGCCVGLGGSSSGATTQLLQPVTTASSTFTGTAFPGQTSTAFSVIAPTITLNYIIKVSPDVNLTTTYGVAAIGGMTGVIACGSNVTCAGNTISFNFSGVNSIQGMTGNITCGAGIVCSGNSISSTSVTYVLPSDYGAVCDGVTNDAVALQNAVTAAAGKALFIPAGKTCLTNAVLTVLSNTAIVGAGRDVSSIKSTISNRGAIFYMSNQSNITISDLYLQGTRSVTSWTLASFGAIDVEQDVSAASDLGNFTFKNLKLSGFNSTYWIQVSIGNSNFNMTNVVMDNILFNTATGDIPTDPTASNNPNYAIAMYGGTTGPAVKNSTVRNIVVNGDALCFGIGLYNTHSGFSVLNNKLLNVGATNTVAHCTNGIGFTNSYGIFNYDISGSGFPSNNGLISGNYILNPYSNGIYTVGAQNATLAYNDYNTIISENTIVGQTQSDLPIRGAIALNNLTNATIIGNKLYNNWAGVVASGQYIGQVDIKDNMIVSNVSGGSCWSIAGALGTTGNVPEHNFMNNTCYTSGTSSSTIKYTGDVTHYLGAVNFSNNKIVADVAGADFNAMYINNRVVAKNNNLSGIASSFLMRVTGIIGGPAVLQNNVFDLATSTTGTGLQTSGLVYIDGATFMNRNSGAAFAFSGVSTTGTLNNMQFSNVATANQVVASSIGLAKPSWSAASQDFVQNLTTNATTSYTGWVNTANGTNWVPTGSIQGQYIGSATNDSATAGNIGEYVSASVATGSAISLTSGTAANITSISLTAGDWDVSGTVGFLPAGSTTYTLLLGWTSTTSATAPADSLNNGAETINRYSSSAGAAQLFPIGSQRLSLSGTTTVYLSVNSTFAVSTMTAYGIIKARRMR